MTLFELKFKVYFSEQVNAFFRRPSRPPALSVDALERGAVYFFRWSCDGNFYRATFEGSQVRFVDFGNSATIESESVPEGAAGNPQGTVSRTEIYSLEDQFLEAAYAIWYENCNIFL